MNKHCSINLFLLSFSFSYSLFSYSLFSFICIALEEEKDDQSIIELQTFFGWGTEDVEVQISAMAQVRKSRILLIGYIDYIEDFYCLCT